ncbi:hypothetical protein DFH08DRAFT_1087389 [Mycena albidolilacea]|uniref:Uncharacterized protein n=1 Tax=Mycena albidolilacea TaxID=1033008 RepID=A0AAD6Z9U5_9AGAR|nr:hypothetical protein DFH08DRAFT_1087389 [Mycena albidolilacea]
MDIIQVSDDPIIPTLCRATVRWLEETRATLMQKDLFPEHYPFGFNSFERDFPVTRGVVRKTLELYPDFTPFPRRCQIAFADHGRTDCLSRLWSIKFETVVLGFFEVPSMIYDDPYQRLVLIRKDLILEASINSINAREKSMLLAKPTQAHEERDDGIEIRLITESNLGGGRPIAVRYMRCFDPRLLSLATTLISSARTFTPPA